MNLTLSDSERAFRDEARDWLAANTCEPLPSYDTAEGFAAHREWERRLGAAGWSAVNWPARHGGRDATMVEWLLFEEEYYAAGAPSRVSQNGIFLLAPTILTFGTEEQRERILAPMAAGDVIWAQAWSEPEAGSDLAAVRATADQVDSGWVLNGVKTWSSRSCFADRAFGLFRSDRRAQRHHGLTYLMFDLDAAGLSVRPIAQLGGGTGFAELHFDDVFVPDRDVLGEPSQGWAIAMATTGSERGIMLRSPGRFTAAADHLLELCARHPASEPEIAQRQWADAVDVWMKADAYRLLGYDIVGGAPSGTPDAVRSSICKVHWSELDLQLHSVAMDVLGPGGRLRPAQPDDESAWLHGYLTALAGPIYGGTNDIQRNIIAQRLLGLPKA